MARRYWERIMRRWSSVAFVFGEGVEVRSINAPVYQYFAHQDVEDDVIPFESGWF